MIDLVALLSQCGVSLYDSEIVNENSRTIYRIYILKDGGVSLDDCEAVSRLLSPIFDVKPPVSGDYTLEVSSPGLERALSKPAHFKASLGELVSVKFLNDNGQNESIKGRLVGADEDKIIVENESLVLEIALNKIKKARTYVQW